MIKRTGILVYGLCLVPDQFHASAVSKKLFTVYGLFLLRPPKTNCQSHHAWWDICCTHAEQTIACYTYLSPWIAQLTHSRSGRLCSGCSVSHPSEAFSYGLSISKLPVPRSFASECPTHPPFSRVEVYAYKETSLSDTLTHTFTLSLYERAGNCMGGWRLLRCYHLLLFPTVICMCCSKAVSMTLGDLKGLYNSFCLPPLI